jgi:hypothetical protein
MNGALRRAARKNAWLPKSANREKVELNSMPVEIPALTSSVAPKIQNPA